MPVSIFGSTSNTGVDRKVSRFNARAEPIGNMNGRPIKNLPFPDEQTDTANRQYVDDELKQYSNSVIEEKVKTAIKK